MHPALHEAFFVWLYPQVIDNTMKMDHKRMTGNASISAPLVGDCSRSLISSIAMMLSKTWTAL